MLNFINDDILIREINKGNETAFEHLFKRYYPRLFNYAKRFVHDDEIARDMVQEVFLRLWIKQGNLSVKSLSSYLFTMVRNGCINYLKHFALEQSMNLSYDGLENGEERLYCIDLDNGSEQHYLYKELEEQVDMVIERLPQKCREVFVMSRFHGLKNIEIANKLQVSTTAVEKHISRALGYFQRHFKSNYPIDIITPILLLFLIPFL